MVWKVMKIGAVTVATGAVLGGVLFGDDLASYARSSAGAVQATVKDSVPIEFELRRARDLMDQIIPQMHANIRLIAQEEVEIAALEEDITASRRRVGEERQRVAKLRDMLQTEQTSFVVADRSYERPRVSEDLARRLELVKESQVMLASKEKLLESRRQSLAAAQDTLERTRSQKALLEDRVGGLESQHRLVQAAAAGSRLDLDQSKLAQTEKLIDQIKKRLDVAERVLAHESHFTATIPVEVIDEKELLEQADEFLNAPPPGPADELAVEVESWQ